PRRAERLEQAGEGARVGRLVERGDRHGNGRGAHRHGRERDRVERRGCGGSSTAAARLARLAGAGGLCCGDGGGAVHDGFHVAAAALGGALAGRGAAEQRADGGDHLAHGAVVAGGGDLL